MEKQAIANKTKKRIEKLTKRVNPGGDLRFIMDICPECGSSMDSNLEHYDGESMTVFFECENCAIGYEHSFNWCGTEVIKRKGVN